MVSRYVAALAGFGPRDVTSWRRSTCLAFAGASVPFQFIPLVVAATRKMREAGAVASVERELERTHERFGIPGSPVRVRV